LPYAVIPRTFDPCSVYVFTLSVDRKRASMRNRSMRNLLVACQCATFWLHVALLVRALDVLAAHPGIGSTCLARVGLWQA
jgi:hypothetical protein